MYNGVFLNMSQVVRRLGNHSDLQLDGFILLCYQFNPFTPKIAKEQKSRNCKILEN